MAQDLNSDSLSPSPETFPLHSRFPTMANEVKAVHVGQGHDRTI